MGILIGHKIGSHNNIPVGIIPLAAVEALHHQIGSVEPLEAQRPIPAVLHQGTLNGTIPVPH